MADLKYARSMKLYGGPKHGQTRQVLPGTLGLQFGEGKWARYYTRHPNEGSFKFLGGPDKAREYRQHLAKPWGKPDDK